MRLFYLIIICIWLVSNASLTHAAEQIISVSPPQLYVQTETDTQRVETITLKNPSAAPQSYRISLENNAGSIAKSDEQTGKRVADWMQLSTTVVPLAPNETKKVELVIKVPKEEKTITGVAYVLISSEEITKSQITTPLITAIPILLNTEPVTFNLTSTQELNQRIGWNTSKIHQRISFQNQTGQIVPFKVRAFSKDEAKKLIISDSILTPMVLYSLPGQSHVWEKSYDVKPWLPRKYAVAVEITDGAGKTYNITTRSIIIWPPLQYVLIESLILLSIVNLFFRKRKI